MALSLGHTTNISWCGLGGDGFFFCSLPGQIRPTARALRRIGQRATFGLFRADTALTSGVGVGGFDLLCGTALPIFLNLLAGNLAPLLYGEIGVLLDRRIGCICQHCASILGCGIIALPLCGGAFPQLSSAFLLCFCPCLFQRRLWNLPGHIAFQHPPSWLFFNIFHGITSVINFSKEISKSFKRLLNSAHKSPL